MKTTLTPQQHLSQTIQCLRFPLMVAVVFIHANFIRVTLQGQAVVQEGMYPVYDFLRLLFSREVAGMAVPLFFFMSGFLFFYQTTFSASVYLRKLKTRAKTLLLPYLFWNLATWLVLVAAGVLLPSLTSGNNTHLQNLTWSEWINIFWMQNNGSPLCMQFWFLRDLMVVMVLSPLVYALLRYTKQAGLLLLAVLWYLDVKVGPISLESFFFFSVGAYFALNAKNWVQLCMLHKIKLSVIYGVLLVASMVLYYLQSEGLAYSVCHKTALLMGMATVVAWVGCGMQRYQWSVPASWAAGAFFIYAYHDTVQVFLLKQWVIFFSPLSDGCLVMGYVMLPLLVVLMGMLCYRILQKIWPQFAAVIVGSR